MGISSYVFIKIYIRNRRYLIDIIIRMNFVNILECYRMEQDILQILEFNEIRRMLAQLCPSSLSKAKAMDLQPSSKPRIIAEHLQETEEASICLQKRYHHPWERPMTSFHL